MPGDQYVKTPITTGRSVRPWCAYGIADRYGAGGRGTRPMR
jgi:hypothetical protein